VVIADIICDNLFLNDGVKETKVGKSWETRNPPPA